MGTVVRRCGFMCGGPLREGRSRALAMVGTRMPEWITPPPQLTSSPSETSAASGWGMSSKSLYASAAITNEPMHTMYTEAATTCQMLRSQNAANPMVNGVASPHVNRGRQAHTTAAAHAPPPGRT